jgi:hypothetical protein
MKFYCGSTQNLTEKPFPKAYKEEFDFVQYWPTFDLERNPIVKQVWEETGSNHKKVKINGKDISSKTVKVVGWFIDFDDLGSILAFCTGRPNKKIVIERSNNLALVEKGGYSIYQTRS